MKNIAIAISIILVAIVGCTTTTKTSVDSTGATITSTVTTVDTNAVKVVSAVLKIGTKTSAMLVIQKNPDTKQYFTDAAVALTLALDSGSYNPNTLRSVLAQIKIADPNTQMQVTSMIQDVLDLYAASYADAASRAISSVQWLHPGLVAVRDGIVAAINVSN